MNMITNVQSDGATEREASVKARVAQLSRRQKIWLAALSVALIGAAILWESRGAPVAAAPPPPVVTVASPLVRQIAEWDDYSGRFEASKSVEVRPRVSGAVVGVHFTDGAVVHQGQLLFTIDPRPFVAALAEARAAVASARSDLSLAEADYGRAARLLAADAVSRSDVDRLRARVQATAGGAGGGQCSSSGARTGR